MEWIFDEYHIASANTFYRIHICYKKFCNSASLVTKLYFCPKSNLHTTKELFMSNPFLKLIDTPAIGNTSGNAFRLISKKDYAIKQLSMYYGIYDPKTNTKYVLGIEVVFTDNIKAKTGDTTSGLKSTYVFSPGEALTRFIVYYSNDPQSSLVSGIKFTTTLDKTFSIGDTNTVANELDVAGSILYGFHGNSGAALDNVGLIINVPIRLAAMYDVVYDLGTNPVGTPKTVGHLVLSNYSDTEQSSSMTAEYGLEHTSSWSVGTGAEFSVMVGTEFSISAGVPFVGEIDATAKTEVTATTTFNYTYGRTVTESEGIQVTISAVIPSQSTLTAQLVVSKANLDIPYTAKAIAFYVDNTQSAPILINGRFQGVSQWDLDVAYNPPKPIKLLNRTVNKM